MTGAFIDPLRAAHVTGELAAAVKELLQRVEADSVATPVVADGWEDFATACGLPPVAALDGVRIAIGGLDHVDLTTAPADRRLGLVVPAETRRRGSTRFADPTLRLWRVGWSPIQVRRIEITARRETVEMVVALARPTPQVQTEDR